MITLIATIIRLLLLQATAAADNQSMSYCVLQHQMLDYAVLDDN